MKKSNSLLALTAAASALPGIGQADQIADRFQFGYRHHSYDEDPIPVNRVLGPVTERYDINVNQFQILTPVGDSVEVKVDYQEEKMSGASPWYTFVGPDGEPVQIMSGATIMDERKDAAVTVKYVDGLSSYSVTGARSTEDDYDATSFAVSYSRDSEDRLTTYTFSADVSNDDVSAVDADIFTTRPQSAQGKRSNSYFFSVAQVLTKNALLKLNFSFARKRGFLSDPYKLAFVDFQLLGDSRPDSKNSRTAAAQFRYFSDFADGALHADYRFYDDNWDVRSHTFDLAWYQNLGAGFQLVPSIRLYNQTEAFFYETFYDNARSDGFYSTDYRLSEYGAVTYSLALNKQFEDWTFRLSADKYQSSGDTGFADSESENPGLLDFELVSVGVDYRF